MIIDEEATNLILSILEIEEAVVNENGGGNNGTIATTIGKHEPCISVNSYTTNHTDDNCTGENGDFLVFWASKKACIDKLDTIGALSLLHMSAKTMDR